MKPGEAGTAGKIEVVRRDELDRAASTGGVARSKAFETSALVQARSRIAEGVVSGWHHHGKRDLFGFLVSGRLRIEDADGDAVELSAGDFFHIPVGLVHRDVNLEGHADAVVVNVMVGSGATVVNVDDPRRGVTKVRKTRR